MYQGSQLIILFAQQKQEDDGARGLSKYAQAL